jgi:hypothetical protein
MRKLFTPIHSFALGVLFGVSLMTAAIWYAVPSKAQSYSASTQGYAVLSAAYAPGLLVVSTSGAAQTITVTGATVGMQCDVAASDGTDIVALGGMPYCVVTGANTVSLRIFALVGLTPPSKTYNVRVRP